MNVAVMREFANTIQSEFGPNRVNLTAGWLAVNNAKVLGSIGSVLVLIKPIEGTIGRLYFACLDSVGFIGI